MTTNNAEALRAALEEIEPVSARTLAAWGPKPDLYTAEQMIAFALASQPQAAGAGGDAVGETAMSGEWEVVRWYGDGAAPPPGTKLYAATPAPAVAQDDARAVEDRREFLGQLVRQEWMAWAREQPNPKPSWLTPWRELTEPEREVDRRIGERIYRMAIDGLYEQPAARPSAAPGPSAGEDDLSRSDLAMLLVAKCLDINAGSAEILLEGMTDDDKPCGDWIVSVRQVDARQAQDDARAVEANVLIGQAVCYGDDAWFKEVTLAGHKLLLPLDDYERTLSALTLAMFPKARPSAAPEPSAGEDDVIAGLRRRAIAIDACAGSDAGWREDARLLRQAADLLAARQAQGAAVDAVATVCLVGERYSHGHMVEVQLQIAPGASLPVGTKLYAARTAAEQATDGSEA